LKSNGLLFPLSPLFIQNKKVKDIVHHRFYGLQPAVEAFTRGGASNPVNITTSGVYQWWYTIGLRTNQDLYIGSIFLSFAATAFLFAGWLSNDPS
jgi:hypothetical protein